MGPAPAAGRTSIQLWKGRKYWEKCVVENHKKGKINISSKIAINLPAVAIGAFLKK
jgi:fructose-1,6-bisphosphatase/sedoheptulose 1,7-bisphosphatase-like protein